MEATSGGTDKSAKEVFDEIGEQIQQEVHVSAQQYDNYLQGDLSKVEFSKGGSVTTDDPCKFDHNKDTNVTIGQGREYPCFGRQPVRFSDTKGAYCSRSGIKGNEGKEGGACAPFRKLHMCDKNLEGIQPQQIETTHNLLVDVLLAALHEGQSIINNYRQLGHNSSSSVCTALARSFADIGDIVRGKDLFLGHKQKKNELEARLQKMFENIQVKNANILTNKKKI